MNTLSIGQKIDGVVEKLVFSGLGLIRNRGMVIFIPKVVPNERVIAEITSVKSSYAKALLTQVKTASPSRITPLCPHFGSCGGCQLQHICYPSQVEIKKEMLKEALFNLYQGEIALHASTHPFGWRRKIVLHGESSLNEWCIGFYEKSSSHIVPINICPIFSLNFHPIDLIKKIVSLLPNEPHHECEATLFQHNNGIALQLTGNFPIAKSKTQELIQCAKDQFVLKAFGCTFQNWRKSYGFDDWTFSCLGKIWHYSPNAFMQNHISMCEELWKTVIKTVASLNPQGPILDLYSGIGVVGIELASLGFEVVSVEYSKEAVDCGLKTYGGLTNPHKGQFSIHKNSVEKFLKMWNKEAACIIVNPPRSGLSKEALSLLLKRDCPDMVYVSCSPATLSRDLRPFAEKGYSISSVTGYDLFPQTTHFETIVHLKR